jgi:protoporphyrinogen/coproporphyrinogen III oxidase
VFSARSGLSNLVDALYNHCGKENFVFNAAEQDITPLKTNDRGARYSVKYKADGETKEILTQNVVFTGGAFELHSLFPFINSQDMSLMTDLAYARVVEVSLGFEMWNGMQLDGFGGLIPSSEKRDILGVLFMSTLFEGRAPEGGSLLTVFMGGIRRPEISDSSDDEIIELVNREITSLMQLPSFNPSLVRIARYNHAIPQYDVKSGVRFETIKKVETQYPGLILGGNMRDGIGMADRAKQGKMLAEQAMKNS